MANCKQFKNNEGSRVAHALSKCWQTVYYVQYIVEIALVKIALHVLLLQQGSNTLSQLHYNLVMMDQARLSC